MNLYKIANGLSLALQELVNFEEETDAEEEMLRFAINGLLAGRNVRDLRKTLNMVKILFEEITE